MKFLYQYRTKENEVRRGEINAANRDSAFSALKANGIKASRLEEAPGVFNKLFGKGKRWIAIGALAIAAAVAIIGWFNTEREVEAATKIANSIPRHQIYGDPEIVAKFATFEGLISILGNDGNAVLGCFAQPGKIAKIEKTSNIDSLLESAVKGDIEISEADSREVRELKQIVNWMRAEMVEYIDNPDDLRDRKMKFKSYYQRLIQRVAEEQRIYKLAEQDLKSESNEQIREERNAKLRRLGLPTIVVEETER